MDLFGTGVFWIAWDVSVFAPKRMIFCLCGRIANRIFFLHFSGSSHERYASRLKKRSDRLVEGGE